MSWLLVFGTLMVFGGASASGEDEVEATSLFGKPLLRPALSDPARRAAQENLAKAEAEYAQDPSDVDKAIWVGRRIAYLGRFRESIKFYSLALQRFPNDPKLLRHRGHRLLTVRDFEGAARDLTAASVAMRSSPDEVEPDGQPNEQNIPIGSLHSNVWYHLGLAEYLLGNSSRAAEIYENCQKTSTNDDRTVSTSYWQALNFARMGKSRELQGVLERIRPEMKVIENDSYHQLLLYFKGVVAESDLLSAADAGNTKATIGYGVAAWRIANGRSAEGIRLLREILQGPHWTSFGYIAAEADLKRMGLTP